ncbi:uncharacterized protein LOC125532834 [Triticum urartu]|uniref:uncharacterized protein LOC125532834 n=1 Tax=Triticum urartu TaxID=4572 RepID=UPI002044076B|nr:uncharacterized protein LOC125532834 [Triticum urartu]
MTLSAPILKLTNRLIRDFLWHGRKEARSSNCLVNWPLVCRPLEFSGPGMRDIQRTGISLHTIGDGRTCCFWTDHWLDGKSIAELAPSLAALVPRRLRAKCLVHDGLQNRAWIHDIRGALNVVTTVESFDSVHSVEETIHIDNEGVCGDFVNVKMICWFGLSEVLIGINSRFRNMHARCFLLLVFLRMARSSTSAAREQMDRARDDRSSSISGPATLRPRRIGTSPCPFCFATVLLKFEFDLIFAGSAAISRGQASASVPAHQGVTASALCEQANHASLVAPPHPSGIVINRGQPRAPFPGHSGTGSTSMTRGQHMSSSFVSNSSRPLSGSTAMILGQELSSFIANALRPSSGTSSTPLGQTAHGFSTHTPARPSGSRVLCQGQATKMAPLSSIHPSSAAASVSRVTNRGQTRPSMSFSGNTSSSRATAPPRTSPRTRDLLANFIGSDLLSSPWTPPILENDPSLSLTLAPPVVISEELSALEEETSDDTNGQVIAGTVLVEEPGVPNLLSKFIDGSFFDREWVTSIRENNARLNLILATPEEETRSFLLKDYSSCPSCKARPSAVVEAPIRHVCLCIPCKKDLVPNSCRACNILHFFSNLVDLLAEKKRRQEAGDPPRAGTELANLRSRVTK